ncbi:hypothetical protein NDK43_16110 [Neobacillus pocheonensis]|uniref:Uncharacterized protein n=1 Tax=Neobacillus pocheonensis TaxID=363869 RepID=A0ABT0WBE7_9BACI|nr:hypothetical protein [Neobacillus pocheonensis]
MATGSALKSLIPAMDYGKMKRWQHVFKILSEPEPTMGHTPRNEVWRKNKSVLWHYPAKQKKYEIPLFFVYSLFNKPIF